MTNKAADGSQPPPYFDILFARLEAQEPATSVAFGRHVHWGYWPEPERATGSPEDYAEAAERLCRLICDVAGVRDGMRVLDVGCGYGGTIASLNERFTGLDLVGINIDPRQLERARKTVRPWNGNSITFRTGDACQLDVPPESFDVVLAVECIFHFGNRPAFLSGAARALKTGGALALSDFVPPEDAVPLLEKYNPARDEALSITYGKIDVTCALERYREIGAPVGLHPDQAVNISRHTLPTYPFLRQHLRTWPNPAHARLYDRATARMEMACNTGLLDYHVLSFRKQSALATQAA